MKAVTTSRDEYNLSLGLHLIKQKMEGLRGIKKAFVDICVDPAGLTIIFLDIPWYNWAKGGEQVSSEE